MKKLPLIALAAMLFFTSCNGGSSTPATTATDASAAKSAGGNTPVTGSDRGRVVFQERCAACHGMNGDAQSNNAANLPHSVLDSLSITQTIKNGRGTMPMFKDALPDSDIASLAVYVKSLRK